QNPVDWGYSYGRLKNLQNATGSPEGLRTTLFLVKAMQETDNGVGPEDPVRGWNPRHVGDVGTLPNYYWAVIGWNGVPDTVKAQVMQAVLQAWFDKCVQHTPQQYYTGGLASPTYVPVANPGGEWGDRVWAMIP